MLNPKIAKELPPFPTEKLFFKISFPTKIFKPANPQPSQKQYTVSKTLIRPYFQDTEDKTPAGNRRLAQWRVKWLIEHSASHQLLWCIDSFVLRNPPLRQAPKRYKQA